MNAARILLIEDDPGVQLTVKDHLQADGYEVQVAGDGQQGLDLASSADAEFDLILLDVMLPDMDGFEVCRASRRRGVHTPILMLTARSDVHDRVAGLRLGADDYMGKPFDPEELTARIEALLRRARPSTTTPPVRFGDVVVDLRGMSVRRGPRELTLTAMEYQLLVYLIAHEGVVVTRDQILREVWGFQRVPRTRTVDVHVTWLRQKIEPDRAHPHFIHTIRGAGYKFTRGDEA